MSSRLSWNTPLLALSEDRPFERHGVWWPRRLGGSTHLRTWVVQVRCQLQGRDGDLFSLYHWDVTGLAFLEKAVCRAHRVLCIPMRQDWDAKEQDVWMPPIRGTRRLSSYLQFGAWFLPHISIDETSRHQRYNTNTEQQVLSSVPLRVDTFLERAKTHTHAHTHETSSAHNHTPTHPHTRETCSSTTRHDYMNEATSVCGLSYECIRP
jgi:hypothetical protein